MSNNKVGVLNTRLTIDEFISENAQYRYNAEDEILGNDKGSWAFVARDDDGKIFLTAERHVPEDLIHDMLSKYGGEFYQSEYDKKPTFVYVLDKEVDDMADRAYQRVRVGVKKNMADLDAQISIADDTKKGCNKTMGSHKRNFER